MGGGKEVKEKTDEWADTLSDVVQSETFVDNNLSKMLKDFNAFPDQQKKSIK